MRDGQYSKPKVLAEEESGAIAKITKQKDLKWHLRHITLWDP